MLQRFFIRTLVAAAVVAALAGCTPERALALKAGAEAFSAKATAAIASLVDLQLRSNLGKLEEEEVLVRRAREALLKTQRDEPAQMTAVIGSSFDWLDEREKLRRENYGKYDELKVAYAEFAAAYRRLPDGSLFAAKDVACSAALGARLVGYMVTAAKGLASNPVPLILETAQSKRALERMAAETVKTRNEQPFDSVVRAHVALLKDQQRGNALVVAQLTDAVEAGVAVLEMIERYNDVSVADLMKGLRQVLLLRESTFGLSSEAQLARLDGVTNKLNGKPALALALKMPVNETPVDCK